MFDALRYDHGRSRKHIQAGRHLSDLRVLRNEADYRDDFQGNLQAQTKLALGKAQQVLDLLHTPPQAPNWRAPRGHIANFGKN